jgi:hypothetical protein
MPPLSKQHPEPQVAASLFKALPQGKDCYMWLKYGVYQNMLSVAKASKWSAEICDFAQLCMKDDPGRAKKKKIVSVIPITCGESFLRFSR